MMNILVVVAHADDEALGCGATIARHVKQGDKVHLLVMADGVSSRLSSSPEDKDQRSNALAASSKILGIEHFTQLDFPDNQMDTVPMLTLAQAVEAEIARCRPSRIYTHFGGDLNVDHRLTFEAVITASRPQPGQCVKSILCFEVVSSTEWHFSAQQSFTPNFFQDVSGFESNKCQAMAAYESEMRSPPHARSEQNVMNLMSLRGATVGCNSAEAFVVARMIE